MAEAKPDAATLQDDPFEVLGLEKTATDDEIKAAHRKLALKYHPDKNSGNADAAAMFQKVSTAKTILLTPELRRKYELGGMDALDEAALQEAGIQVDVSQTGFVTAGLLAMFRKLGQPVRTVVPPNILEAVANDAVPTTLLPWDAPQRGKAATSQAVFYNLYLTQEDIDAGFVIAALSPKMRVKVLLWDRRGAEKWNLAAQEDSGKVNGTHVAALYATRAEMLDGVPRSVQEAVQAAAMREKRAPSGVDTAHHLFHVLDDAKPRDRLSLQPGEHLVAVYGDNFFSTAHFTLAAQRLVDAEALEALLATDRALVERRGELHAFEKEFSQAQKAFEAAAERLQKETEELNELFKQKEHHQACVLGIEATAASPAAAVLGDAAAASPRGDAADASPKEGVATAVRNAGQTIHKGFWKLFSRKGEEGAAADGTAAAGPGGAADGAAVQDAPRTDVLKAASDTGTKGAVNEGGGEA